MNKYEKLIEYIINDDDAKARALFHEIVVEKSRDIYESLMDEEQYDEGMGGNQVNGMMDEIQADESGMAEDEEMDMMGDEEPIDGDDDMDAMGGDDMGGEGDIEDRVMDLETELDALKAEFEQLMGDEAGEEEHSDMDFGGDEEAVGDEESMDDEEDMGMMESAEEEEDDEEEDEEESMEESRNNYRKSDIELMREYVEKVTAPANSEGHEAAAGGSVSNNKQSIVAGKNDMGGTTANIAKGGAEADPSSTPPAKTGGVLKKGDVVDVAKRNVNVPGGNKGAQDFYGTKAKAKSGEEGGVNKSSIEGGK